MSAPESLKAIEDKLDIVIRLLAVQVADQREGLQSKATTLSSAGLQPKTIAQLCGTTPNTVSVSLSAAKRKKKTKKTPKKTSKKNAGKRR